MKLPKMKGIIKRRILLNFQVDPEIVAKCLPPSFSPKTVNGKSIIGICLIRLEKIRPKFIPFNIGLTSENVAHRIAVNWTDTNGELKEGVYIFRRDSNSLLNTLFGERLFPGEHKRAKFRIEETSDYIDMQIQSTDKKVLIDLKGCFDHSDLNNSVFQTEEQLVDFFKAGNEGYSPVTGRECYQGMCLIPYKWNMEKMKKEKLEVNYFREVLGISDNQLIFDSVVITIVA